MHVTHAGFILGEVRHEKKMIGCLAFFNCCRLLVSAMNVDEKGAISIQAGSKPLIKVSQLYYNMAAYNIILFIRFVYR